MQELFLKKDSSTLLIQTCFALAEVCALQLLLVCHRTCRCYVSELSQEFARIHEIIREYTRLPTQSVSSYVHSGRTVFDIVLITLLNERGA